jgi:uncharacterized protein YgiM (DUF1202 family)
MQRKILFIVGILGILFVGFLLVRFLSNRGPKFGELRVDSQTPATIFLDNKNIGKTPYKDKVATGEYTLKLVSDSTASQLTPWQGKITVGQNLLTFVNANLSDTDLTTAVDVVWLEKITSKQSELSVTTTPDGATILVDDVSRGVTPLSVQDISPGDHSISVTNIGFLTRSIKIKTTAGYRVIANLKLALSGSGQNLVATETASESASLAQTTPTEKVTPTPTGKLTPTPTAKSGSTTLDPEKPFVVIKDTPTGFLRVRVEPSTSASEAGRVNPGEKFGLKETKNGWYQILFDGKNLGWVSGQYVDKVE